MGLQNDIIQVQNRSKRVKNFWWTCSLKVWSLKTIYFANVPQAKIKFFWKAKFKANHRLRHFLSFLTERSSSHNHEKLKVHWRSAPPVRITLCQGSVTSLRGTIFSHIINTVTAYTDQLAARMSVKSGLASKARVSPEIYMKEDKL